MIVGDADIPRTSAERGGNGTDEHARGTSRVPFVADVSIRRSGAKAYRVGLFDLSPEGCRIEFVERPAVGERAWIKFDRLQAIEGVVRWVDGHVGGVAFTRPLHDAVFDRLTS